MTTGATRDGARWGRRTWLAIVGVTLLHAALSLGLLWSTALAALSRIDTGTPPTAGERIMGLVTTIVWYPVAGPVMSASWVRPSGFWAYLLMFANSAVWATLIVLAVRALRARRRS